MVNITSSVNSRER
ncbi:hypothetical protein CP09DC77_1105, partial [Chlamydia psittaci 09DC77]